jgi:hypothetical protein
LDALRKLARFAFFFLTALVFTSPLARHLSTHLPLGTETAATVPLLNLWTLIWNAQSLIHGYAGYWNAPIFYPETGAFALSDPQPLTGLLFAFLYLLFTNPVIAYNLVFLFFLTLNGVAGASWVEAFSPGKKGAAILTGLLAQSLPFVTREWGVLQLTAIFPIFFALEALIRFGKTPSSRAALTLGWWTAATFLTSSYYGLFLGVFLLLGGIIFMRREHLRPRALLNLVVSVLLAGALLLPVLSAHVQWTREYSRSENTIKDNSAQWVDYFRLDSKMWGKSTIPWLRTQGGSGQRLYPGTSLLVLAAVGMIFGWRKHPRIVISCLAGAAVAFGISLGLNLDIKGWQPYSLLRNYIPGFAQLRSPFRMGVFVQIFLVGLAGLGMSRLLQRSRSTIFQGIVILLGLASLAEIAAFPARLWMEPSLVTPPKWVEWLAAQPDGAVAMIPFPSNGETQEFETTALAMVLSLEYQKPLVNGYSGFFPRSYREMRASMQHFPDEESLIRLGVAGARYLVVDPDWLTAEREATLFDSEVMRGYDGEEKVVLIYK